MCNPPGTATILWARRAGSLHLHGTYGEGEGKVKSQMLGKHLEMQGRQTM